MPDGGGADLAALVTFDRHGDRLYDLAHAITRDHAAAAEVVRDVVAAADGVIGERAALYARVRGAAFDWLAGRGRLPPEERVIHLPEVTGVPTPADLGSVVWAALGAYSERDQALLTLRLRHGIEEDVLADAMGVAEGAVGPLLERALQRAREEVGALLALLGVEGQVVQADLAEGWDGTTFSPFVRRRVAAAMVDAGTSTPDPLPYLQAVPLVAAPPAVREAVATRLGALHEMGALARIDAHPHDLDDTLPPGTVVFGGEDDPTIPPELAIPLVLPPAAPAAPDGAEEADVPDGPATDRTTPDKVQAPPRKVPLALSVALGAAAALVVAAAIARVVVTEPVAPEPSELSTVTVPEIPGGSPSPSGAAPSAPASSGTSLAVSASPDSTTTPRPGVPDIPEATEEDTSARPADTVEPGTLVAPGGTVDVPAAGTSVPLRNAGAAPLEWRLASSPEWARVSPVAGALAPGAAVELRVTRAAGTVEGDHTGALVLVVDGASAGSEVAVRAEVDRSPELSAVQFGTRVLFQRGCGLDSTEVAVTVTDESGLAEVAITVTGPAPDTQTRVVLRPDLTGQDRYVGVAGPFDWPGNAQVLVTATDIRGNTATADGGTLTVAPCPAET